MYSKEKFYNKAQYFILKEAYQYGKEIAKILDWLYLEGLLTGRSCNKNHDYGILAQMIYNAGHGDHLEIGTLFGASAIIAGLTKKKYKLRGKIICIDPLNGYYGENKKDTTTGITPKRNIVEKNLLIAGITAELITKNSFPFPKELETSKFVSTYIDGDHWEDMPTKDWTSAAARTSKYIMFDNYDKKHPAVVAAVETAEWRIVNLSSIVVVLENR